MQRDRIVLGMAAVFAGMTVLLAVLAAVARSVVPAIVAVAFGVSAEIGRAHV